MPLVSHRLLHQYSIFGMSNLIHMTMNIFATNPKKVDVLTKNGWKTFDLLKDAAEYIGCAPSMLSAKLIRDLPCKGYQVRYHENNES
jgi:hypothetical protein